MIKEDYVAGKKPVGTDYSKVQVLDRDWLTDSFLIADGDLKGNVANYRYFSSADQKYTDTSLGGAIGVNAAAQFTRYADIRRAGRRQEFREVSVESGLNKDANTPYVAGSFGMGRLYSELVDDNLQIVHFEFGVPKFASLFSFLGRAVDRPASIMATDGRSAGFYNFGKGAGTVLAVAGAFTFFSVPALLAFGLVAIGGAALKFIFGSATNKYYTVKPAMHVYWSVVNTIVTILSVEMGFINPQLTALEKDKIGSSKSKIDQKLLKELNLLLPGLIDEKGFVDVFSIVNKGQSRYLEQIALERQNSEGKGDAIGSYKTKMGSKGPGKFADFVKNIFGSTTLYSTINPDAIKDFIPETIQDVKEFFETDKTTMYKATEDEKRKEGWFDTYQTHFTAVNKTKVRFASFKVDYVGTVNESFGNNFKELIASGLLNGAGSKARDIKFSLSGGNILGDKLHTVGKQVGDVIGGLAEGGTFGILGIVMGLMDGGMIELPQQWAGHDLTLPVITYKMTLTQPYGHPYSIFTNQLIPIAMLMAGVTPLATGMNSYTSPLLCKLYVRGVQNIALGMMKDVSITRGTTNLGWDDKGRALGMEVTFSVIDLSTVLVAPVNPTLTGAFKHFLDDESVTTQYLMTLAGAGPTSTKFLTNRIAKRALMAGKAMQTMKSAAYWGDWTSSHLWLNYEALMTPRDDSLIFKNSSVLPGQS